MIPFRLVLTLCLSFVLAALLPASTSFAQEAPNTSRSMGDFSVAAGPSLERSLGELYPSLDLRVTGHLIPHFALTVRTGYTLPDVGTDRLLDNRTIPLLSGIRGQLPLESSTLSLILESGVHIEPHRADFHQVVVPSAGLVAAYEYHFTDVLNATVEFGGHMYVSGDFFFNATRLAVLIGTDF